VRRAVLVLAAAAVVGLDVLGPDGGPADRPTLTGPRPAGAAAVAAPSPGGYVFLQSLDGGRTYSVVVSDGGGGSRRVVAGRGYGRPQFSPDGRRVVFAGALTDGSDGRIAIYTVGVDGSGLRRLTTPGYGDEDPAWSPDGRWIAFSRTYSATLRRSAVALTVMAADGSAARVVPTTTGGTGPAWSPDSRTLVYSAPDGLRLVRPDGGGNTLFARGPLSEPAWAPDNTLIAAIYKHGTGSASVVAYSTTTRAGVSLEGLAGNAESPSYHADSRTVSFVQFPGEGEDGRGTGAIYRVTQGGSPQLVVAGRLLHAGYSPAGAPGWTATVQGRDGQLWVRGEGRPWTPYGGRVRSPAAVTSVAGYRYYVAEGGDGRPYWRSDALGWARLSGDLGVCGAPAAVVDDGYLFVACRPADGGTRVARGRFSLGVPVLESSVDAGGRTAAGPALGVVGGSVRMFVTGGGGVLYTRVAGTTGSWVPLPVRCADRPGADSTAFAGFLGCRGPDGTLHYSFLTEAGWAPARSAGGRVTRGPGIAMRTDGRAYAFVTGTDGAVYATVLSTAGAGGFTPVGGFGVSGVQAALTGAR
jgi:Tol biopolymer transport system component